MDITDWIRWRAATGEHLSLNAVVRGGDFKFMIALPFRVTGSSRGLFARMAPPGSSSERRNHEAGSRGIGWRFFQCLAGFGAADLVQVEEVKVFGSQSMQKCPATIIVAGRGVEKYVRYFAGGVEPGVAGLAVSCLTNSLTAILMTSLACFSPPRSL